MQIQEVTSRVNETLNQGFEIPLESLKPEANLFTDLKLDSLDAIDLLVYLEEKMNIKVEADIFKEVRTLGDVYQMVAKLSSAPSTEVQH